MPRPSLCLNIPKTGSSFTSRFFDAADWLELRRRCGLGRLAAPNRASVEIVRRIKRYGPGWGNLTCRFWDHHAGYSSLPSDLRRIPKLCTLRDLRGWYCSFYLYYTTAMTDTLLWRAIRLLVGGDATAVRDRGAVAILSRHRRAFLERFRKEDAGAGSIGNLSIEFVVWFTGTVRLEVLMHQWVGMDGRPAARTGFLTFRAITILFDDPGKVFRMRADERAAYFASGAYLQDVRCRASRRTASAGAGRARRTARTATPAPDRRRTVRHRSIPPTRPSVSGGGAGSSPIPRLSDRSGRRSGDTGEPVALMQAVAMIHRARAAPPGARDDGHHAGATVRAPARPGDVAMAQARITPAAQETHGPPTGHGLRRATGDSGRAGPATGRLASTRSMTRRFSICARSAPAASRAQRSHGTGWSRVSASATAPTRSSRSSGRITSPDSHRAAPALAHGTRPVGYISLGYPFNRSKLRGWVTLVLARTIRGPWASSRPGSGPMRTA